MSRHKMTSRQVGLHARRLLIGMAIVTPVAMASAIAAPTLTGLPESARLVSDNELGEMRGRYIEAEQVNFFGIQMVSMWQTGDGSVLTASLEFEVDVNNGQFSDNAALHANWSGTCVEADCDDPGLNIPNTIPSGLTSVNGAVQSTQISGDDNDVVNILNIRIGDYNADSVGYEGDAMSVDLSTAGPLTSATRTVELTNGFVVKFSKGDNSLGMILQGPGDTEKAQGQVVQSINDQVANQIAQHAQLIGDANAIQSTLDVVIGIDQLQTQLAVETALSSMKGWGF